MFESLKPVIDTFNSLTPLGLAGLLGFIIYKLVQGNRQLKAVQTNHLHELPEMAETLRRMETAQTTAVKDQAAAFATIITLLQNRKG